MATDLQVGQDRPAGHQTYAFERGATQPTHTATNAFVLVTTSDRNEPTECVFQWDRYGLGSRATRQRDARVELPADGRPAD